VESATENRCILWGRGTAQIKKVLARIKKRSEKNVSVVSSAGEKIELQKNVSKKHSHFRKRECLFPLK
jgi:hypothetical protein